MDARFLFIDRDGVINRRLVGDYVREWSQFEWLPQADEALAQLSRRFERVIIVTNQRGISRGFYTADDVMRIHSKLLFRVGQLGGCIDLALFAPEMEATGSTWRKPDSGMALHAQQRFPEIDFEQSIMIGDMPSDMEFGHRLNMKCIHVGDEQLPDQLQQSIYANKESLKSVADFLLNT